MTIFDVRPEAGLQRAPEGEGWVAASHAAVQAVLRDPGWSSDPRTATGFAGFQAGRGIPDVAGELLAKVLVFMDPPDHVRLRGLISKAFTPRSVERLRPRISQLTEQLLAPLRDAGRFDVINDFAFPLPVTVICELLGVPADDREMFRQHTRDLAVILDWDVTPTQLGTAAGAALNFAAYLVPLFEERRRQPKADLISALVAAEEAGDRLGADELLTTVILLLTAGHETTMNLIGNGLLALLRNPDQLELLRARPELMTSAVEELLRYDSPVRLTVRTALADAIVVGETVRAGEQVLAMLDAANHDPAVFDVARHPRRHPRRPSPRGLGRRRPLLPRRRARPGRGPDRAGRARRAARPRTRRRRTRVATARDLPRPAVATRGLPSSLRSGLPSSAVDGVHDLGGMQGFGPVVTEPHEPPFHEPWEGRTHGMMFGLAMARGIRGFRWWIESMGNDAYLSTSYYEHWLHAIEHILLDAGALQPGELDAAVGAERVPTTRWEAPEAAALVPKFLAEPIRPARPAPPDGQFTAGDRVRVTRFVTSEHNRVPRYLRGVEGVVESAAGAEPLEEGIDRGDPQPVYSVAFAADDLWGDEAEANTEVIIDLFEKYLEPA